MQRGIRQLLFVAIFTCCGLDLVQRSKSVKAALAVGGSWLKHCRREAQAFAELEKIAIVYLCFFSFLWIKTAREHGFMLGSQSSLSSLP